MAIVLVSEQLLTELLKNVRKAQKKLTNQPKSRELIDELDFNILCIEATTFAQHEFMIEEFCKQENLIPDLPPWD